MTATVRQTRVGDSYIAVWRIVTPRSHRLHHWRDAPAGIIKWQMARHGYLGRKHDDMRGHGLPALPSQPLVLGLRLGKVLMVAGMDQRESRCVVSENRSVSRNGGEADEGEVFEW